MRPAALKRSAWRAVSVAVVMTLAVSCGGGSGTEQARAPESKVSAGLLPPPRTLGDLRSLDDLGKAFDAARGRYRVVLLLSPT